MLAIGVVPTYQLYNTSSICKFPKLENTHFLVRGGKYYCTTDLLLDWFGFDQTSTPVANSTYTKKLNWYKQIKQGGSGCDSVGRVVASDSRGPQFDSSPQQNIILNIYCQLY